MKKLVRILPFMDQEEIKELAFQVINNEVEGVKLVVLFPFINRETLEEIVDLLIDKNDGKNLTRILPFVSSDAVDKVYEAVKAGTVTGVKETYLFPFLGKSQLKSMFHAFVKEVDATARERKESEKESDSEDEIDIDFDINLDEEDFEITINKEDVMKQLKKELKKAKEELKKFRK